MASKEDTIKYALEKPNQPKMSQLNLKVKMNVNLKEKGN